MLRYESDLKNLPNRWRVGGPTVAGNIIGSGAHANGAMYAVVEGPWRNFTEDKALIKQRLIAGFRKLKQETDPGFSGRLHVGIGPACGTSLREICTWAVWCGLPSQINGSSLLGSFNVENK